MIYFLSKTKTYSLKIRDYKNAKPDQKQKKRSSTLMIIKTNTLVKEGKTSPIDQTNN